MAEESKISYYEALGRRKVSTARVRLYVVTDTSVTVGGTTMEKGAFIVNGRSVEQYSLFRLRGNFLQVVPVASKSLLVCGA